MAKRWINSMDVDVGANGAPLFDLAGCANDCRWDEDGSLHGDDAAVGDGGHAVSVRVGRRRVDSYGNPQNTRPCFVGDQANQNVPIMPSNYEGVVIRIDDASKLHVKVGVNNQGVVYRIFA